MPATSAAQPAQPTLPAPKRAARRPVKADKRPAATPAAPVSNKAALPAKAKVAKAVKVPKARVPSAAPAEAKPAKHKLVRDSFTMPADEYATLDVLKRRALTLAHPAKKSEILRAGLQALSALSDQALLAALTAVHTIKTGRPKTRKPGKD